MVLTEMPLYCLLKMRSTASQDFDSTMAVQRAAKNSTHLDRYLSLSTTAPLILLVAS